MGDQYVNADLLLLSGDKIAKHNADGKPICRSNQNPILDTQLYEVEFPREEITELAANIIAESMYV